MSLFKKTKMTTREAALPGREQPIDAGTHHFVNGNPLRGPRPEGHETAIFGMGCFWGAEKQFWQLPGVFVTAVGYAAGFTPNPDYLEVCSGMTGHTEAVLVVFDPDQISYEHLLKEFWENHDPTQGMRQGNDVGTQYRSGVYARGLRQLRAAEASRAAYQQVLTAAGHGEITTEIIDVGEGDPTIAVDGPAFFNFAEEEHQQYLAKHADGYCGLGGTGVECPVGLGTVASGD
ncbi:MAG: peptide-methionine (S)-S-oxide reductase MsrA [Actinobacteria bacterium]|nr:peptide-methionine (S)-S-oxide reductase MsrA [Actinomycetota bacterium]